MKSKMVFILLLGVFLSISSSSVFAECAEDKTEVLFTLPNGVAKFLCLDAATATSLETAEDHTSKELLSKSCDSNASCSTNEFCSKTIGICKIGTGLCKSLDNTNNDLLACTQEYEPVCGCDNQTYSNTCEANAAGINIMSKGKCTEEGAPSDESGV